MAPLPLLKLAGLLVKTVAKPVATRMKVEARKHPNFSKVCITIGEFSHQITSRMNVLASGYKILGVNPLPEEEALARGINFLSESIVFVVAGSIIIIEYARSEAKSALKAQQAAEAEAQFRQYLESKFDALSSDIQILNERIKNLEIAAEEQEGRLKEINIEKKEVRKRDEVEKAVPETSSSSSWWNWLMFR